LVLVSSKAVADSEFYELLDWSLSVLSKPKLQESLINLLKSEGEVYFMMLGLHISDSVVDELKVLQLSTFDKISSPVAFKRNIE
jgi:hypothetical protein